MLRRAQVQADRSPDVVALLHRLSAGLLHGVHLDSVRLLDQRPDGSTVLVAADSQTVQEPGYPGERREQVLCMLYGFQDRGYPSSGEKCGTVEELRSARRCPP